MAKKTRKRAGPKRRSPELQVEEPTRSSRFLDLPVELRLIVYRFVFEGSAVRPHFKSVPLAGWLGASFEKTSLLVAWCLESPEATESDWWEVAKHAAGQCGIMKISGLLLCIDLVCWRKGIKHCLFEILYEPDNCICWWQVNNFLCAMRHDDPHLLVHLGHPV